MSEQLRETPVEVELLSETSIEADRALEEKLLQRYKEKKQYFEKTPVVFFPKQEKGVYGAQQPVFLTDCPEEIKATVTNIHAGHYLPAALVPGVPYFIDHSSSTSTGLRFTKVGAGELAELTDRMHTADYEQYWFKNGERESLIAGNNSSGKAILLMQNAGQNDPATVKEHEEVIGKSIETPSRNPGRPGSSYYRFTPLYKPAKESFFRVRPQLNYYGTKIESAVIELAEYVGTRFKGEAGLRVTLGNTSETDASTEHHIREQVRALAKEKSMSVDAPEVEQCIQEAVTLDRFLRRRSKRSQLQAKQEQQQTVDAQARARTLVDQYLADGTSIAAVFDIFLSDRSELTDEDKQKAAALFTPAKNKTAQYYFAELSGFTRALFNKTKDARAYLLEAFVEKLTKTGVFTVFETVEKTREVLRKIPDSFPEHLAQFAQKPGNVPFHADSEALGISGNFTPVIFQATGSYTETDRNESYTYRTTYNVESVCLKNPADLHLEWHEPALAQEPLTKKVLAYLTAQLMAAPRDISSTSVKIYCYHLTSEELKRYSEIIRQNPESTEVPDTVRQAVQRYVSSVESATYHKKKEYQEARLNFLLSVFPLKKYTTIGNDGALTWFGLPVRQRFGKDYRDRNTYVYELDLERTQPGKVQALYDWVKQHEAYFRTLEAEEVLYLPVPDVLPERRTEAEEAAEKQAIKEKEAEILQRIAPEVKNSFTNEDRDTKETILFAILSVTPSKEDGGEQSENQKTIAVSFKVVRNPQTKALEYVCTKLGGNSGVDRFTTQDQVTTALNFLEKHGISVIVGGLPLNFYNGWRYLRDEKKLQLPEYITSQITALERDTPEAVPQLTFQEWRLDEPRFKMVKLGESENDARTRLFNNYNYPQAYPNLRSFGIVWGKRNGSVLGASIESDVQADYYTDTGYKPFKQVPSGLLGVLVDEHPRDPKFVTHELWLTAQVVDTSTNKTTTQVLKSDKHVYVGKSNLGGFILESPGKLSDSDLEQLFGFKIDPRVVKAEWREVAGGIPYNTALQKQEAATRPVQVVPEPLPVVREEVPEPVRMPEARTELPRSTLAKLAVRDDEPVSQNGDVMKELRRFMVTGPAPEIFRDPPERIQKTEWDTLVDTDLAGVEAAVTELIKNPKADQGSINTHLLVLFRSNSEYDFTQFCTLMSVDEARLYKSLSNRAGRMITDSRVPYSDETRTELRELKKAAEARFAAEQALTNLATKLLNDPEVAPLIAEVPEYTSNLALQAKGREVMRAYLKKRFSETNTLDLAQTIEAEYTEIIRALVDNAEILEIIELFSP